MRYPFDKYVIGTRYGEKGTLWKCGFHSGVDFMSKNYGGDGKIHPLYLGTVQQVVYSNPSYGNCVYVRHPDGYITLYAHMNSVLVNSGQKVFEDTTLGIEGDTGNTTGLHCHVEVHYKEYNYPATINPLVFIKKRLEDEEMTQDQFDAMMNDWLERQSAKSPAAWSKSDREWAERNGIITGDSTGDKKYNKFCTREEMIAFLHRLSKMFGRS